MLAAFEAKPWSPESQSLPSPSAPIRAFPFSATSCGHVSRNMKHVEARTQNLRLSAPEGIEAKLQHPVGFFLDLPNLSNDVLTKHVSWSMFSCSKEASATIEVSRPVAAQTDKAAKILVERCSPLRLDRQSPLTTAKHYGCGWLRVANCLQAEECSVLVQAFGQGLWLNVSVETCSVLLSKPAQRQNWALMIYKYWAPWETEVETS